MDFMDNSDLIMKEYVRPVREETLERIRFVTGWRNWGISDLSIIGKLLDDVTNVSDLPYVKSKYDANKLQQAVTEEISEDRMFHQLSLIREQYYNLWEEFSYIECDLEKIPYAGSFIRAYRKFMSLRLLYVGAQIDKYSKTYRGDTSKGCLEKEVIKNFLDRYDETFRALELFEEMLREYRKEITGENSWRLKIGIEGNHVRSFLNRYSTMTEFEKLIAEVTV